MISKLKRSMYIEKLGKLNIREIDGVNIYDCSDNVLLQALAIARVKIY